MVTWQQPGIASKCNGTANKVTPALQKQGESSSLSYLSLDSSTLCKTISVSQNVQLLMKNYSHENGCQMELTNTAKSPRAFSLFSKVACVMTISFPTSPIMKPKNSLQLPHRYTGRVTPQISLSSLLLPPKQGAAMHYTKEFPDASNIYEPILDWTLTTLWLNNVHHNVLKF